MVKKSRIRLSSTKRGQIARLRRQVSLSPAGKKYLTFPNKPSQKHKISTESPNPTETVMENARTNEKLDQH